MSKRSREREQLARQQAANPSGQGPIITRQEFTQTFSQHSGPLPSPESLRGYEAALPGSADRIIRMAEEQASHRHEMERRSVDASIHDARSERLEARIGQIFGLIIGLAGLSASVAIIIIVPTAAGASVAGIVGGTTVVGLVATFLVSQRRPRPPMEEKGPQQQAPGAEVSAGPATPAEPPSPPDTSATQLP